MSGKVETAAAKIEEGLRAALGPKAVFEVRELDHGGQVLVNVPGCQTTFGYLAWIGNKEQEDRTAEFVQMIVDARACAFRERAAIVQFESGRHVDRQDAEKIAAEHMSIPEDEIEFLQGSCR